MSQCYGRFATMQAAATAAPARRPPKTIEEDTPSPPPSSGNLQDPALVSQLQARFDALAIEESQGKEGRQEDRQTQWETGVRPNGKAVGKGFEHHPVVLVLDGELQKMPWESLPSMKQQRWLLSLTDAIDLCSSCEDTIYKV